MRTPSAFLKSGKRNRQASENFRYAMLLITVAAAIVTPTPDATTMLVFMAPMIALYFVSVLVSYLV
jgi:sec-independent protein translocase protein TatC